MFHVKRDVEGNVQANQPTDIFFDGVIHDSQFAYLFQQPDIDFWIQLAKVHGPRVLELACGTGRITIPVAEAGIAIDGVDFSESMLRVARQRAHEQGLPISFVQADIRGLTLGTCYDFIFLPSGTISHLLTRSDLETFLASAHRILSPGGIIALDVHNPTNTWLRALPLDTHPVQASFQNHVTKETVAVETVRHYASDTQIFTIEHRYTFADASSQEATIVLRAYFPQELEALLYYNGFTVTHIYGNYDGKAFGPHSRKYVVLAKPRAEPT